MQNEPFHFPCSVGCGRVGQIVEVGVGVRPVKPFRLLPGQPIGLVRPLARLGRIRVAADVVRSVAHGASLLRDSLCTAPRGLIRSPVDKKGERLPAVPFCGWSDLVVVRAHAARAQDQGGDAQAGHEDAEHEHADG